MTDVRKELAFWLAEKQMAAEIAAQFPASDLGDYQAEVDAKVARYQAIADANRREERRESDRAFFAGFSPLANALRAAGLAS